MQIENSDTGRLLTVEERSACVVLAEGDSLQSQRAQALLALDAGATHKEASEQTGLTLGQVQYWLKKFRDGRMTIFPDMETPAAKPEKAKKGKPAAKSKKAKKKKKSVKKSKKKGKKKNKKKSEKPKKKVKKTKSSKKAKQ